MRYITLAVMCTLAGCATPMTASTVGTDIAEGQLLCAAGSATVAMQATSGRPILATRATSAAVAAVCGLINGVAVSPPANGVAGTVTVALPATITVPLKG